jgi:adenine-specific DNA-methyltransferase
VRARELRAAAPDAEHALWRHLRNRQLGGYKFRRQHPIGPYFADFACIETCLVVELGGGQHYEAAGIEADARRSVALAEHGFAVLRFSNRDALLETDAVLQRILNWLQAHRPHPNPLPSAGEGAQTHPLPPAGEGVHTPKDEA